MILPIGASRSPASAKYANGLAPRPQRAAQGGQAARSKVAKAIIGRLRAKGGVLACSQNGLAGVVGAKASRATVRRALESLAMAGKVAIQATHTGSVLRLL